MTTLVSIDPNVKRMALAVWKDGVLYETLYLRADLKGAPSTFDLLKQTKVTADEIAVETMQIYRGGENKKKSLLKLNFFGGFACGAMYQEGKTTVHTYTAQTWKGGSIPKEIMLPRIQRALSEDEITRVTLPDGKSYHHDVWDSVGIGLHHLGRL